MRGNEFSDSADVQRAPAAALHLDMDDENDDNGSYDDGDDDDDDNFDDKNDDDGMLKTEDVFGRK